MDNELNNKISEQNRILSSIDQNIKTMNGNLRIISCILTFTVVFYVLSNW